MRTPTLRRYGTGRGVALLLPGGQANGHGRAHPLRPAALRMRPFVWELRRAGVAVAVLGYRHRGWNGTAQDPVVDARWALARLARPVVLIGHSMGGRAALHVAGDPAVVGVCALAPWIAAGDPVTQLRDRPVLIAHGEADRVTNFAAAESYADRARRVTDDVAFVAVEGDGHAMLRRPRRWAELVRAFAVRVLSE